jgi:hypothetical protein
MSKNTFSVAVGEGISDFTYQIILQSIFMTKKHQQKFQLCNEYLSLSATLNGMFLYQHSKKMNSLAQLHGWFQKT